MSNNFFPENCAFREIMSTNVVKPEGSQIESQYGAYALYAGSSRLHARTRMYRPERPGTHKHARKHARVRTDE